MPWRRQSEREEIVHIVVTGYQKKMSPRKHYVSAPECVSHCMSLCVCAYR